MLTHELVIETEVDTHTVRLRLSDGEGVQLGSNLVKLGEHRSYDWEGLFDTQRHVKRYQGSAQDELGEVSTAVARLEQLGVFLGQEVLGDEIMTALCKSRQRRTLLVRLPALADDVLGAAFARIPWEIARPASGEKPLMERNLVVRAITEATLAGDSAVHRVAADLAKSKGAVRVLVVFAEAPGSRPLAMRLEREGLRRLFEDQILPRRKIQIDVLCHGVTGELLREQIRGAGGYHIVHWSGHGHHNSLELRGEDDGPKWITGGELVALIEDAGGFVPQLFFLSACLSGTLVDERTRAALQVAIGGAEAPTREGQQAARSLAEVLDSKEAPGFTGTALELLRCGVPQVVAMRYSVGDDYARELARCFYKRLLVDDGKHTTEDALALARTDLLPGGAADLKGRATPVDHANPLVFGQGGRPLDPVAGRSQQMQTLRPQPAPLLTGRSRELERPALFVGRGRALTEINRAWQTGGAAVAVVQGMAGLGKTVLAAEALHLWHGRFDWVLAFQAKPTALAVEAFFRGVDMRLSVCSSVYRSKCGDNPYSRVYFEPSPQLRGEPRYEQMLTNLLEALRDQAVLVVLDNFESNLEGEPRTGGRYACADPHWEAVLDGLSEQLAGTRSRVLMTTRHRPRALSRAGTLWLPLGPLPRGEAWVYVRSHVGLSALLGDEGGLALLKRLLRVSRGHPLILDRLGALAGDRVALDVALVRLSHEGLEALPELSASLSEAEAEAEAERGYLEDVAKGSVDILIERMSPEARRLLWVVTLANEPVGESMLAKVWAGRSEMDEQMQRMRSLLAMREQLPAQVREQLDALPPEQLEQLEGAEASEAVEQAPVGPLLLELHEAGLLSREQPGQSKAAMKEEESGVAYGFHELVRERVAAWAAAHPHQRGQRTAEQLWVAYGQRYAALFEGLYMSGQEGGREAAAEAGRRALVYLVRAGDFDGLSGFASKLVTGTKDPTLLGNIIAELRAVAEQVPAGEARWSVRTYLADALKESGRPDEALPLFEEAAAEAEQAEHWADVAWICANWAVALRLVGQLDTSKATHLRSAEASRKTGQPQVDVVGRELEALRIDVMQGHAAQALPEVEAKLAQVRGWWTAHADKEPVPEAPDLGFLGRAFISGLDIARQANHALKRWQGCLDLLAEVEETKRTLGSSELELAITRFNRYGPLLGLGRLDEAQRVLEGCLDIFRKAGDLTGESRTLGALADLWNERGDLQQAADLGRRALAVCNRLPDPEDRAISHNNLAKYLVGHTDAAAHLLAALTYRLVPGHHVQATLRNIAIARRQAAATDTPYAQPRLAELLTRPTFDALRRFLSEREVDLGRLQSTIDQLLARAEAPSTPTFASFSPQQRQLLAPLYEAATAGRDTAPLLAALRTQLLELVPEDEAQIDAFVARVRAMLDAAAP